MSLSIVVTAYDADVHLLPRLKAQIDAQTVAPDEVICVVKNATTDVFPAVYTPVNPEMGDRERRIGLDLATGDRVCWISADNEIYPNFVETHNKAPEGSISVVNIDYWKGINSRGVFPKSINLGAIDLTNFAIPREIALKVGAFRHCNLAYSDWDTLDRAMKFATIHWDRSSPVCARHN